MANTKKKTNTGNKKGTKSSTSTTAKKKTTTVSASKQTAAKKTTAKKKTTTTVKKAAPKTTTTKKATATKKAAPKKTTTAKKVTTAKKSQAPKKKETVKEIEKLEELESLKEERVIKTTSSDEKRNKIFTIVAICVLLVAIILSCAVSNKDAKYNEKSKATQTTTSTSGTGGVSDESASIKDEERKELNNIGIDEYLTLLAGEEPAAIYLARPTCSHCQVQKPIMENLVYKYDVKINYLNTDELDSEGMTKLQASDDFFSEGWGTPTTLIVKGGKVIDSIAGETSGESLVELFKKYGIINE